MNIHKQNSIMRFLLRLKTEFLICGFERSFVNLKIRKSQFIEAEVSMKVDYCVLIFSTKSQFVNCCAHFQHISLPRIPVRSIGRSIRKEQRNDTIRTNSPSFVIYQSKRNRDRVELIFGLIRPLRDIFALIRIYLI